MRGFAVCICNHEFAEGGEGVGRGQNGSDGSQAGQQWLRGGLPGAQSWAAGHSARTSAIELSTRRCQRNPSNLRVPAST